MIGRLQPGASRRQYLQCAELPCRSFVSQELKECNKDIEISGLQAKLVSESDLLHWKGEIKGPQGTPYESGKFIVDINLPADYPFVPPKMKFDTQIWHPNISSQSGAICLDILKNEWSPALTIRTALISLQALLSAAEPDDPQDAVVAKMYKEDREKFDQQARYWTEMYAKGAHPWRTTMPEVGPLPSSSLPSRPTSSEASSRCARCAPTSGLSPSLASVRSSTLHHSHLPLRPSSSPGFTDDSAKVQQLMEMGFPEDKAKAALAASGGDENAALEKLLSE